MSLDPAFQQLLDAKRRAVATAKKNLEKAEKNLETTETELRVLEQAAEVMSRPAGVVAAQGTAGAKRGMSERWKAVIAEMATAWPGDVSLEDIASFCLKHGIEAQPDTIRGQMHLYSERNYLERTAPGRFKVTAEGAATAGVSLEDANDAIPF